MKFKKLKIQDCDGLTGAVFRIKLLYLKNVVKCCQYYFGFNLPSAIWLKHVQKFEAKFKECDNLFCKLTVCK